MSFRSRTSTSRAIGSRSIGSSLSVMMAYAAIVFVGAIVLGLL